MNNYKKIFLFLVFLSLFIFILIDFCLAEDRELEIQYPIIGGIQVPAYVTTLLPDYIKYIFYLAISIAGLAAFGALIYGGVRWLTSAGSPAAMSDAKDQIFAGILGLILLLSSYLVLNTINPQLITLKSPEISPVSTPPLPELKTGKVCLYDKKCGESDRKLLNCFSGEYPHKPTTESILSAEIKEGGGAVAFFEGDSYSGRRICLKDAEKLCDLTQYSFSGNLGDNLTDNINSLNIIPAEKCALPSVVLPQGPKDDFSAAVIAYKNKNFANPAVLTFFGEGEGRSTEPPDVINSIWIKDGSLAVRLFSNGNYGAGGGKTICFRDSVDDLTKYYYLQWLFIGWDIRIRSMKIIYDSDCDEPGITKNVPT